MHLKHNEAIQKSFQVGTVSQFKTLPAISEDMLSPKCYVTLAAEASWKPPPGRGAATHAGLGFLLDVPEKQQPPQKFLVSTESGEINDN